MEFLRKREIKKILRGSAVINSARFRGFTPLENSAIYGRNRKGGVKVPSFLTGFTLIEMVVYVSVCSIILGSLAFFAFWALRAGAKAKMEQEVLNNGRRAMEIMIYEIKKSESVYPPTSVFDSNPGQLSLEQKTSSLPQESETFSDFFRCGQVLCFKRESQEPIALTSANVNLTNLQFSKLSNSATATSIQIKIELESSSDLWGQPETKSKIRLQNTANLNVY